MAPITIITVTYSPGEHLTAFLDSLSAATQRDVRVIIVDNGSRDGAPEAACEQYPFVELVYSGANIGYGAGMNKGFRHVLSSTGNHCEHKPEYIVVSNPDVVFSPGSLDRLIEASHRYPRAGALGPRIVEHDGSFYPSARAIPDLFSGIGHALLSGVWPNNPWTKYYHDDANMDEERCAGWLSGSCMVLRVQALESVGGFDERYFMYFEDVDLCDRLAKAGWQNVFVPSAQIHHAQGHSAKKYPHIVIRAHHASAYRFQADRYPGLLFFPLRLLLKVGLQVRQLIVLLKNFS